MRGRREGREVSGEEVRTGVRSEHSVFSEVVVEVVVKAAMLAVAVIVVVAARAGRALEHFTSSSNEDVNPLSSRCIFAPNRFEPSTLQAEMLSVDPTTIPESLRSTEQLSV
jgi:hypothetical protein